MKLLSNGTGAYLTGDAIADAVVDLGVALSNEQRVGVVEFPFRALHGGIEHAVVTVGWQTRVNAESRTDIAGELVDSAATAEIVAQTDRVVPCGDTPMSPEDLAPMELYDVF
ncbi:MAG: hypothetical protein ABWY55_11410 [Microbacterium sp.]